MTLKRAKWWAGRLWPLLLVLVVTGLAVSGCVSGLQSIGWSGGAVSDGTLFVGSKEGRLVSVNLANGRLQWSESLKAARQSGGFGCVPELGGGCGTASAGVAIYGTPVVAGDLVYIGGYNGKIYAFTTSTLATRWVYPREDYLEPIVGGLVVAQGKVYFGDSDGKVYALDAATGDKMGEFLTGDKVWATPAISGDTLYVGSFDKKLYALSTGDLTKKWEFATEGAIISTPLVHNGTVYFGSFDRHLYAVNAADGSFKWRFMGENWFWAQPVLSANTIYAGCLDRQGRVYALQPGTGTKIAEFALGSPVSSSPVVVDNSIIWASRNGVIYALDTRSNQLKQLADIKKDVYGPLCASEGVVYIHTTDLALYPVDAVTGAVLRTISLKS